MSKGISLTMAALLVLSTMGMFLAHGPVSASGPGPAMPMGGGSFGGGDGTAGNPYIIEDVWDLQNMSANLSAHYVLWNDIDASLTSGWNEGDPGVFAGFVPVGNDTHRFTGSLDGRNYTITGLYINRPSTDYVGLVGYIDVTGSIRHVNLVDANVTGGRYVGALVGDNSGTIYQSGAAGDVTGTHWQGSTGGLVGHSTDGFILHSYAAVTVIGRGNLVGGLAGYVQSAVVQDSYATGNVLCTGGPLGHVGGLAGWLGQSGSISNCYATGNVDSDGRDHTGGLVGINYGPISDSYATGDVSGANRVGGLVGWNNGDPAVVTDCYAIGAVTGTGVDVGGLVGEDTGTVDTSFYDRETTFQDDDEGRGEPKTTAEMMTRSTFTDWDFATVWWMINGWTYPLLMSQGPVVNVDTGKSFDEIQVAIDDADTLDGHTIAVYAGTYVENVIVNKSLTIIGNGSGDTTIMGEVTADVVTIGANWVNVIGFNITGGHAGVFIHDGAHNNIISENTLAWNIRGLYAIISEDNTFVNNHIHNNSQHGIYIDNCQGNAIYHNRFQENTVHAFDNDGTNTWDAGYPMGGNYWSDHTEPDGYRGAGQDIDGRDGIVDVARDIAGGAGAQDNYPWANPDFQHVYLAQELLMHPAEFTYVMVGDNITITATAWDRDLGQPVPDVDVEFTFPEWGQQGTASFLSENITTTDENGVAQVIFHPGEEIWDQWEVHAMTDDGLWNHTARIEVALYRGDLALFNESEENWDGIGIYEEVPDIQFMHKALGRNGTAEFFVLVLNAGSLEDTLIFNWDNSSFDPGWGLNVSHVDMDTWDFTDVTNDGPLDLLLQPWDPQLFFVEIHSPETADYLDEGIVQLSVLDSAGQWDNGTLRAHIPVPDVMFMVMGDDREEVLIESHPVPLSDFLPDMNIAPDLEVPPFWGVLYNSSTGIPLDIVEVTWELINIDSSAFIDPGSGSTNESVRLNTGPDAGTVTISASYEVSPGVWWNDSWTFTVTVGWDSVNITYDPEGLHEIPDQDVRVGDTIQMYASVYNDTHGFVTTTIIGDWDGDDSRMDMIAWFPDGSVVMQFTDTGSAWVSVTIYLTDGVLEDIVYFNVLPPPVERIEICYEPDDGWWLWDDHLDVGQYQWYNISAYYDGLGWPYFISDIDTDNLHWTIFNQDGAIGELHVVNGMARVYSGTTGGTIWLNASYYDEDQGEWFYDEIPIYVNPPRVDEIKITYDPEGQHPIESGTIAFGAQITGYAAAYNNTIGFIGLVGGMWSVNNPGGADSYTDPLMGTESQFHGATMSDLGDSWWNLEYHCTNHWNTEYYSVNFDFLSADWINITDADGNPVTGNMVVDGSVQLYASAYNWSQPGNHWIGFVTVTWDIANSGGAAGYLDPVGDGVWTVLNAGTVTGGIQVSATFGTLEDTASFTVLAGELDYIRIELQDGSAPAGTYTADDVTTLYLRGYDAHGNLIGDVSGNWALDSDNATLSAGTGTNIDVDWAMVGVVNLTAEHSGMEDVITVTVSRGELATIEVTPATATITADETQQFTATGFDAKGNEIPALVFTWAATNGTIAAGLFTPWSATTVTVNATSGGIVGEATVTVTPGTVASITVSPAEAALNVTESRTFTATAHDAKGNVVTTAFTWSAENGTITTAGVYTATHAGTWEITAEAGDITGTATVTVSDPDDDDPADPGDDDDPTDPDDDDPADPGEDTVPIVIGPVLDSDGDPVSGAAVTVTYNGTAYYGTTNATGHAIVNVPESAQGENITVDITKPGYDPISYNTTLAQDGTLATQPPAMDEAEPEEKGGIGDYMWIILILILAIVAAILAFAMRRRKTRPVPPEEGSEEDDSDVDPKAQDYNSTRSNRRKNEFGGEDTGPNRKDIEQPAPAKKPTNNGDEVDIIGMGEEKLAAGGEELDASESHKAAKTGRNPQTGKEVQIAAKNGKTGDKERTGLNAVNVKVE